MKKMSQKTFLKTAAMTMFTLFAVTSVEAHGGDEDQLAPGVIKQDVVAARAADIALLANELGISIDAAERSIDFQESFSRFAERLLQIYPNEVSRLWIDPAPAVTGHVQFVGAVPEVTAPQGIALTGGGVTTLDESHRRAKLASEALRQNGYANFATYFDAPSGRTRIQMQIDENAPEPDRAAIVKVVQDRVWRDLALSGEALVISESAIDLAIVRKSGEIYELEHSRGGNWVLDDGFRECTSGWSVSGPSGDGIITAAHCVGLNEFEEPGLAPYSMTWRDQERGDGDAEYHTTSHIELAEFFATSSSIRDVNSKKFSFFMFPGTSVCVYGRSSNIRGCSHAVEATFVTVTFTDGVTVSDLVRASGDTSIGGDSGGGWSWNTEAWGVHSGSDGSVSYFTPVDVAEAELNVNLKIAP